MNRRIKCYLLSGLLMTVVLSGCGFHLRGKLPLPPELSVVYIKSNDLRLADQLEVGLTGSGATVTKSQDKATAVLTIYNVGVNRRIQSVGGLGRVREYSLRLTATFDIKTKDGKEVLKRQSVSLTRDYSFTETQVVGKSVEEEIIINELRRDIVFEIIRRVRYKLKSKRRSAGNR